MRQFHKVKVDKAIFNSILAWIISLVLTGYVGLSTMLAGIIIATSIIFISGRLV